MGPVGSLALPTKFTSHSSGTKMSENIPSLPLLQTTDTKRTPGPFRTGNRPRRPRLATLSFRLRAAAKAPGVTRTILTYSKARGALAEEVGSHHFLWEGVASATQLLPTPVRCPSQQLGDHTQRQVGLWQRSLLVITPWEQTASLPGRLGERARRARKGEAAMKRHRGRAAFADDYGASHPRSTSVFISTW